jgi:hypothetical protein
MGSSKISHVKLGVYQINILLLAIKTPRAQKNFLAEKEYEMNRVLVETPIGSQHYKEYDHFIHKPIINDEIINTKLYIM